jgi:hypothetical protein
MWKRSYQRTFIEMGLVGVISTQLWHQTYIDPSLADLPSPRTVRPALAITGTNGTTVQPAAVTSRSS